MSYVELKLIKGRLYGYLRESIRIGKRVIHKNIKYLGAVSPVHKAALEPIVITPMIKAEPIKDIPSREPKEPSPKAIRESKKRLPSFKIEPMGVPKIKSEPEEVPILIKKKIKKKKKIAKKEESENLFRIG